MQKVMLIGDSIRLSYRTRVQEMLEGRAEVLGPDDNCRFAFYTLFYLQTWLPDDDYDVIHWNNGQWDVCYMADGRMHTELDAYVDLEKRIADILLKKGHRLIFATTTPVHADQYETAACNPRKNEDIVAYNEAAVKALTPMGVEINDLYTPLARDVMRYISEDKVHLSPDGIEMCAQRVTTAVMQQP